MIEDVVLSAIHDDIELQISNQVDTTEICLRPQPPFESLLKLWLKSQRSGGLHDFDDLWWWESSSMEMVDLSDLDNRGWRVRKPIKTGELLAVAVPIVAIKDSMAMFGGQTSHCLLYQLGRLFKSSSLKDGTLIDLLSNIYPRYPKPKKKGKKIPQKILNLLSTTLKPIWDTEKKWDMDSEIIRLLDCMKFNSIGVYQNNEQFGYSSRYEKFNSSCLYPPVVSLFNHSCRPNVDRVFYGTVVLFRATMDVPISEPLCISYIESESLVENRAVRRDLLSENWDFICNCDRCEGAGDEEDVMEVFGEELRSALAELPAKERFDALQEIQMAVDELTGQSVLFDHRLRLLSESGVAKIQLGHWEDVWDIGSKCLSLTRRHLGPNNEAVICFSIQCARSAAALFLSGVAGENWCEKGKKSVTEAMRVHKIIFGGSHRLIRSRLHHEIKSEFLHHPTNLPSDNATDIIRSTSTEAIAALVLQWMGEIDDAENTLNLNNLVLSDQLVSVQSTCQGVPKFLFDVPMSQTSKSKKRLRDADSISIKRFDSTSTPDPLLSIYPTTTTVLYDHFDRFGRLLKYRRRWMLGPFLSGCGCQS